MIKPTSCHLTETYVILNTEYDKFKNQLNNENKTIIRISPTYVANKISDRLVVTVIVSNVKD